MATSTTHLNDSLIRPALIRYLAASEPKPKAILEELRVHNGNAIADVVALFDEAHCFEIKGITDKIERIVTQGTYYNAAFRWITLVTTSRRLARAVEVAPPFWGIIEAQCQDDEVIFRQVRGARQNPKFTKQLALLTLWKSEMLSLMRTEKISRQPREVLAELISTATGKIDLSNQICRALLHRHESRDQRIPLRTM